MSDNPFSYTPPDHSVILERIRERTTIPPLQDRVTHHLGRVALAIVDWDAIEEEEDRIEHELGTGRYRANAQIHHLGVHGLAVEAIVDRVHQAAMNGVAAAFEMDHVVMFDDRLNEPKLIAALFFEHQKDAEHATRSLKRAGFGAGVYEEDPLFPAHDA